MSESAEEVRDMHQTLESFVAEHDPGSLPESQVARVSGPHLLMPVLPRNRPILGWLLPGEFHLLKRGHSIVISTPEGVGALALSLGDVRVYGPAFILEGLADETAELRGFRKVDLLVFALGACLFPGLWLSGLLSAPLFLLGIFATLVLAFLILRPHRIVKHSLLMFRTPKP